MIAGCLFPDGDGPKELASSVKYPNKLTLIKIDVSSDQSVKSAFEQIAAILNNNEQLWAVVNNAGIGLSNELEWADIDIDFKRTFDVNFFGTVRVIKAALPLLRESKGRVVNISSVGGRVPFMQHSAYCASKAAVTNMGKTLRWEVRKFGIKVINIEPFFYATGIVGYDGVKKSLIRGWESLPESIKHSYGVNYLNSALCFLKANSTNRFIMNKDIDEVARTVRTALTLNCPDDNYAPMSMTFKPVIWLLTSSLPVEVHELIGFAEECAMKLCFRTSSERYEEKKKA